MNRNEWVCTSSGLFSQILQNHTQFVIVIGNFNALPYSIFSSHSLSSCHWETLIVKFRRKDLLLKKQQETNKAKTLTLSCGRLLLIIWWKLSSDCIKKNIKACPFLNESIGKPKGGKHSCMETKGHSFVFQNISFYNAQTQSPMLYYILQSECGTFYITSLYPWSNYISIFFYLFQKQ